MTEYNWTPPENEFPASDELAIPTPESANAFAAGVEQPPLSILCWRCGKLATASYRICSCCGATLYRDPQAANRVKAAAEAAKCMVRTLVFFGIMLGISVIAGIAMHSGNASAFLSENEVLGITLGLEAIDTVLVIVALCMIQVPFRGFTRTFGKKAAAWIGFSVILAGLLLLNVAYHHFLRQIAPAVQMDRETFGEGAIFWLWCVAICLQPAVVEELFFRYLSLGALRSVVGVHSAVWLSAMMFALAHIYVPLSLPVLFCLGVGLGYARVASGGMALPMVLHLLHNAAVMYLQSH